MTRRIVSLLIVLSVVLASLAIVFLLYEPTSSPSANVRPHEPIEIHSNEEFMKDNGVVSGKGTEESPYVIENWEINATPYGGIWITDTDAHFIIRNVLIRGNGTDNVRGIECYRTSNGEIANCTIGEGYTGIGATLSSNFKISDNTLYNNSHSAIMLSEGTAHSTVERNIISSDVQTWTGIYLAIGANNISVTANLISNLHNSLGLGTGIDAFSSNNLSIGGNNVFACDCGIRLYQSDDSVVYHNIISGNLKQAFDNGLRNRWSLGDYPGGWGNYWSDYNGTDSNGDLIGDTHYSVPPLTSEDMYPLMTPYSYAPATTDSIENYE